MKRLRVLLYGDQNLNIMDGSSIWLTSLANILTYYKNVDLTILLKTPIRRTQTITNIKNRRDVRLVDINQLESKRKIKNIQRLSPKEASFIIEDMDKQNDYDLIITRGKELASNSLQRKFYHKLIPYITDFDHRNSKDLNFFKKVHKKCPNIFVQTEEMRTFLATSLKVSTDKFLALPPTVEDVKDKPSFGYKNFSIVYTGKFSEQWETTTLLKSFEKAKKSHRSLTLNIAGDKFQGELNEKKAEVIDCIENTKGINWVGAVSREESLNLIMESDIGFAYRSDEIDNNESLELSTKFLEYGINGKPVLVRKINQYIKLLGEDYPFYCDSFNEVVEKTKLAFSDEDKYIQAAEACYNASQRFQISKVSASLLNELSKFKKRKETILFAGHDFKFINWYINHCKVSTQYDVLIDKWDGHNSHDYDKSLELIKQADIVFCEWGLGNAVFYSRNKMRGQKLFVRVHRQEVMTNYLNEIDYDNVTNIIAISPYAYDMFHKEKQVPREKMKLIYNMVDFKKFNLAKKSNNQFNIGILGILPKLKRLDRAVAIFEKLWKEDSRYKLLIKGKLPQDLPWLQNRPEEMQYYEEIFDKISKAPWNKNVIFDSHGDDVASWFSDLNYILSTSDLESFHLAPMEGMASGTVPVIFDWLGASSLYPKSNMVSTVDEAVQLILNDSKTPIHTSDFYREIVRKFDREVIAKDIDELVLEQK